MKLQIKRNKRIVAYIILTKLHHNGHTEIEYLHTDPEFRGQGLASKLIKMAKKKTKGTIVGFIEPHPDSPITREQEEAWLVRIGFRKQKKYDFGSCFKTAMVFEP